MGHIEAKLVHQKFDEAIFMASKWMVFAKNIPILKIFLVVLRNLLHGQCKAC